MSTKPSRKTRFIRETVSYAVGVSCVAVIALVREVNLLVFITGLLLVPLIINSYFARSTLWRVTAKRRFPDGVCAGESTVIEIDVEQPQKVPAAWTLVLQDHFTLVEPKSLAKLDEPVTISTLARAQSGRGVKGAYRVTPSRRGKYRFGPLEASTRYPLGFVESRMKFTEEVEWCVLPRLGALLPEWRYQVETHRQGEQRSHSRRGFVEGEFHGMRQWRDGDSRRWIHWRTSARTGRLMVRQFERQQNQDLILLLDLWRPAKETVDDCAAIELAISFAATVIDDLCKQGAHRLCLFVSAENPLLWSGVTSQIALTELLAELAIVEAKESTEEPILPREFQGYATAGTPILTISTRLPDDSSGGRFGDRAIAQQNDFGDQMIALNVRRGDLNPYFTDLEAQ